MKAQGKKLMNAMLRVAVGVSVRRSTSSQMTTIAAAEATMVTATAARSSDPPATAWSPRTSSGWRGAVRGTPQGFGDRRIRERPLDRGGDGSGVGGIEPSLGHGELGDGGGAGGDHRSPAGHGLDDGQTVALVEGGKDEQVGGLVGGDEGRVVHIAGQAEAAQDAEPPGEPNNERALLGTRAECDDERAPGTQVARQERVGPEQGLDVLAVVDPANVQEETPLKSGDGLVGAGE